MLLFKLLHLVSACLCLGGVFFTTTVLPLSAVETLDEVPRLCFWSAVLKRFFDWMWGAIGTLLVSGFFMTYLSGGVAHVATAVHLMLLFGVVMMASFVYVFFFCFVPLTVFVNKKRWTEAATALARTRRWLVFNLFLGILSIAVMVSAAGVGR